MQSESSHDRYILRTLSAAGLAILSALVTFAVYLPALGNGFVNIDDPEYVYENPNIRALGPEFIRSAFTSTYFSNWHPLTTISYAMDYSIWGLDPRGYHLVNIVFHTLNAFLVFILFLRLTEAALSEKDAASSPRVDAAALAGAFTAALLFGLHPLHVESVAWISERKDVLCAFFFLLGALTYVEYARARRPIFIPLFYAASLVFFALGLLSKPMAVSLPAALLVLDFFPLKRLRLKDAGALVFEKAPFIVLGVLSGALTIWAQRKDGALAAMDAYPLAGRAAIAVRAYAFYIYKMAAPVGLAPYYPHPSGPELFGRGLAISAAFLLAITAFCLVMARRKRIFLSAWLYYAVTLFPVAGIIQVGDQAAADRYTYLPSLGVFMLAGSGVWLISRGPDKNRLKAVAALIALFFTALSIVTIRQERVWKDSVALWTREIEVFGGGASRGYIRRGLAYERLGDYGRAINDYTAAISLSPASVDGRVNREYLEAYVGRGITFGESGNLGQAISDFNRAIELDPSDADAYQNRGAAYLNTGEYARALDDFRAAIRLKGEDAVTYYNMGVAYLKLGDTDNALVHLKKASGMGLKEAEDYLRTLNLK